MAMQRMGFQRDWSLWQRFGNGVPKVLTCFLCILLLFPTPVPVEAAARTFTLNQAKRAALSSSSDMQKTYNEIILKQIKYTEAVEGIKAKVKNLKSFRWSPLLSFKFPQKLKLTEDYDLNVKPLTIQAEITTLRHKLADLEYEVVRETSQAYLDVYVAQQKSAFAEERLQLAQQELSRNQGRLLTGLASQTDVDTMQKSVEKLTGEAAQEKRTFETAKKELSDLTGINVTLNYKFTNPIVDAEIPRSALESLTDYTLEHDQYYYETKMALNTAKMNLDAYESFFRSQYGSKVDQIQPFLNAARQGQKIDSAAFQMRYRTFLQSLDAPWNGSRRILFFRFPKEWFKGEIDGTRYNEDELYALYTACLDYASAASDLQAAERDKRKEVSSSYEALVTARNAYQDLARTVSSTKEDLDRLTALNRLGKAEYSEVSEKRNDYQSAQMDALEALADYNTLYLQFDRLTCGAASKYASGESLTTQAGSGFDSYLTGEDSEQPTYYIYTDVEDLMFVFGVRIPEGFDPEITAYEIWYEGKQIGSRAQIDESIRHLAIDYGETSALTVRLYNGDRFVDECEIDTSVAMDVLPLTGAAAPVPAEPDRRLGTYRIRAGSANRSEFSIELNTGVEAKYYALRTESGAMIAGGEPVPVDESLSYLSLLAPDLGKVTLVLYDSGKQELYTARLDTSLLRIIRLD